MNQILYFFISIFSAQQVICSNFVGDMSIYFTQSPPIFFNSKPIGYEKTWKELIDTENKVGGISIEYQDGSSKQFEIRSFYKQNNDCESEYKKNYKTAMLFLIQKNDNGSITYHPASKALELNNDLSLDIHNLEPTLLATWTHYPDETVIMSKILNNPEMDNMIRIKASLVEIYLYGFYTLRYNYSLNNLIKFKEQLETQIKILYRINKICPYINELYYLFETQIKCEKFKLKQENEENNTNIINNQILSQLQ